MAARAAMMANEARQRQEELVAIGRAARVEVDLEPTDVPPTPHAGVPDQDLPSMPNEGHQAPEVVRSPSPALDVAPLRESIPALRVPGGEPPLRKLSRSQSSRSSMRSKQNDPLCPQLVMGPLLIPFIGSLRREDMRLSLLKDNEEVVVGGSAELRSPVFMGVDAFSHLSPGTIDKSTHRLGMRYKCLDRAREEINHTLKLITQLPPGETPLIPDW
ncbi:hypothetical protein Salat_1150900 [Sesamum alatum]|uniref:Uncharacterized protein n=1 Tax=Sesamum alatum TaxID=300844 RepID=A0AAE1YEC5_9LAMI|nr:hypothetical protein Salat_1150900 [Sesamum alatum]